MPQTSEPVYYRIFVLSVWCDSGKLADEQPMLRFRLQNPHTGVQHGFGNPDALITFLKASLIEPPSR